MMMMMMMMTLNVDETFTRVLTIQA